MKQHNDALAGESELTRYEERLVKRERSRLLVGYLIYGAFTATLCGILASIADFVSARPVPITQIFFSALGLGSVAAIVISRLRRVDKNELMIRSESIIGSHSVMMSALELEEKNPEHPFTEAIRNRANRVALRAVGEHADRATVTLKAPKGVSLLPLLLVVYLVLVFFAGETRSATIDPSIRDAGLYLEEIGDALAARSERDTVGREIAEEMQRLGRELRSNRMSRGDTERAISEFDDRLAKTIDELEGGNPQNLANRTTPRDAPSGNRQGEPGYSSQEIQHLYEQLIQGGDIDKDEADFLEDTIEQLESPAGAKGVDAETEDRLEVLAAIQERGEEQAKLESARDALGTASSFLESEADRREDNLSDAAKPSDSGETSETIQNGSPGTGSSSTDNDSSGSGDPATSAGAGDIAVEDTFTDDFMATESEFQVLTDLSGEVEERNEAIRTLVRNLPVETRTELPYEDVIREYGEQLERAVVRSDVSTAMRSYVREYFIRLNEIEEGNIDGK